MSYFILQTLFWLLLSFVLGLILGRWLKRLLCNRTKPEFQGYSAAEATGTTPTYSGTADKLAFRDRGEHTPKTNERSSVPTKKVSTKKVPTKKAPTRDVSTKEVPTKDVQTKKTPTKISTKTATAGIAAAAVTGAVSHSLSRSADETKTEDIDIDLNDIDLNDIDLNDVDLNRVDVLDDAVEIKPVDGITIEAEAADISLDEPTAIDAEVVTDIDSDADIAMHKDKTRQAEVESAWKEDANIDDVSNSDTSEIKIETDTKAATGNGSSLQSDDEIAMKEAHQDKIESTWDEEKSDTTTTDPTTESTNDDGLLLKSAAALSAAAVAASSVTSSDEVNPDNNKDIEAGDEEGDGATIEDSTHRTTEIVDKTVEEAAIISKSTIAGLDADNLQIIEGIGPKMQKILYANGVHDWKALSLKSEADLRGILDQYDDRYKGVENLGSWVSQAKLAADGDIDELIQVQKVDGISKVENKFGITGSGDSTG